MKKLSVIVPVYNVEKYLRKCLDSIINQTYKNIEILLIDDGSQDNSGKICDEYRKLDKRIKVIHKKNGGLSSARNIGIEYSTGEFLVFIDSDDYIDENMFKEMMEFSDKNDLVICGVTYVDEKYNKIKIFIPKGNFKEVINYSFACNKIFKKDLFKEVKFPQNRIFEDLYTVPKIFINSKNIKVIEKSFYFYYQRNNSISNKRNNTRMFDLLNGYLELENYLKTLDKENYKIEFIEMKNKIKNYFLYKYFSLQTFKFKIYNYNILKEYLKNLKLWNFLDNFRFIFSVIYPRYYVRKVYIFIKKWR